MKIVLIESLGVDKELIDGYAEKITDLGHEFEYYYEKTTDPKEMINRTYDSDIVMIANNPLPEEVLDKMENVKLINVAFTGVDHVPVEAAKAKGVDVCNASGYSDIAVSEMVFGLVLDLYRNISLGNVEVREGGMPRVGREIRGRTVGIVGTGNIGTATAKLFHAFGAKVIGYDVAERDEFKEDGGSYVSLEELLKESDIVSLHLPANQETARTIGKEELEMMKDDAILINCARGLVVDNDALADALNTGVIAGAGIDVYDMEPPIPADYKLMESNNSILTPHVAYFTEEAMVRRAAIAFDNTLSYLKGEKKNLV